MKLYYCLVVLLLCSLIACERVYVETPVPSAPVHVSINILRDAPILDVQGGFVVMHDTIVAEHRMKATSMGGATDVISQYIYEEYLGYAGIVVFRSFSGNIVAFDLCCPNELKRDVRVEPNMAGSAICPVCKTQYDIGFGSGYVTEGQSKFPLKQYTVLYYGDQIEVVP